MGVMYMDWSSYTGVIELNDNYQMIFNNISGHIDIINKDNLSNLNSNTEEYLYKRGYLTDKSKKEEDDQFKELSLQRFRDSQINKKHTIILTYDCNLRCSYCYEKNLRLNGKEWVEKRLSSDMIDKIYKVIDHFDNNGDDKSKSIVLFGGEPLLPENREIVQYILQEGKKEIEIFR